LKAYEIPFPVSEDSFGLTTSLLLVKVRRYLKDQIQDGGTSVKVFIFYFLISLFLFPRPTKKLIRTFSAIP